MAPLSSPPPHHPLPSPPLTTSVPSLRVHTYRPHRSLSSSTTARSLAAVHARALRLNLPPTSPLLYNTLIHYHTAASLHSTTIHLFLHLLFAGARPNEFTFPFVLKSSALLGLLPLGRQIHTVLLKTALLHSNIHCAGALLDLYSKLAPVGDAHHLFDSIPDKNVIICNAMISAYTQAGACRLALELLTTMEEDGFEVDASSWNSVIAGCVRSGDAELALEMLGAMLLKSLVKPNSATFNTLLPAIPNIANIDRIKELHGFAVRSLEVVDMGAIDIDRLWSAILSGYAEHGYMIYAHRLFERNGLRTSRICNSMISGFLDCRQTLKAFNIFREMAFVYGHEAWTLSGVSLTLLIPACTRKAGMEIHAYACRKGLEASTSVSNALVSMYARKGDMESAVKVFDRTGEKDVVSWNTMVSSYALIHDSDRAFELFREMLAEGVRPDEYSFSAILSGCRYSSYFRQGIAIHGHVLKSGFCQSNLIVQNALMDAYSKFGCVEDARKVFDEMECRDNITWNTIISCYGINARPYEAFSLFKEMQEQGWKPNRVTFIALLSACSHAGLLDEGLYYFEAMTEEYGIAPDVDHYACIVDNLGRAGQLTRAYQFINNMPIKPDDCVWSALLSSCRIHGNIELAEVVAKKLIELDPQHSGYWVLLSNIYADASRWKDVAYVRQAMRDGGVKKCPGYSWIELGGSELHRFLTSDKSHRQRFDIYSALNGLTKQLKDEGYVPLIDSRSTTFDRGTE